jgi:hypothetical protein
MSESTQAALDSALMFAREHYRICHSLEGEVILKRREIDDKHREAFQSLAPLNNVAARVMRRLNNYLKAWYDDLTTPTITTDDGKKVKDPFFPRLKYDSSPRIEWGTVESAWDNGFRAAFNYSEDIADVHISARVYCHRWRVSIARGISTTKWAEIERFLETLTEAGKSAIAELYHSNAPSWMDTK